MKILILIVALIPVIPISADSKIPPPAVDKSLEKIPHHLRNRCSLNNRLNAIENHGGDPTSEHIVLDALRYLKKTQNEDGSWTTARRKVPMTSFALLCFLGHGDTAQSEEFGITVLNAIDSLIKVAKENKGRLSSDFQDNKWPYEHAIATQALAEAYSLCHLGFDEKIPHLKRAVELAGQFLINKQHPGGGWEYAYSEDSPRGGDVSITTWHMCALKSCKLTGLEFKNLTRCYKKGLDYIESKQMPSGAIGYSSPNLNGAQDGTTLAALGAYCFQIWKSPATKVARKSIRFIDQEMKFDWDSPDADLYGHFFASHAMFNHGGPEWERYHKLVFTQLLKNQAPDGSFLPINQGDRTTLKAINGLYVGSGPGQTHYRTCLATLMLQTYYRNPHPFKIRKQKSDISGK